jgi:hypothetical protein
VEILNFRLCRSASAQSGRLPPIQSGRMKNWMPYPWNWISAGYQFTGRYTASEYVARLNATQDTDSAGDTEGFPSGCGLQTLAHHV